MESLAPPRSGHVRASGLAAALVLAFYFWTAAGPTGFGLGESHDGHYNLLARAFLSGQLHLPLAPRPELFELAEPYDPSANDAYRLHDASLYHGRYYLYFGAVPAVTLFVPWRLLGLGDLPEPLAAALFASGAFGIGALLLDRFRRRHLPEVGPVREGLGVVVLGFACVAPFVLRRPAVYEVAITAGAFYLASSVWFFWTACDAGAARWRLAAGGLCLGLAVGCRPHHVLIVPFVLALALPLLRTAHDRVRAAALALVPLGVVALLLGAYNLARFGSFAEWGTRYMLLGAPPVTWFDVRGFLRNLYFHFLAPPFLAAHPPFVFLDARLPTAVPPAYFVEPTVGMLAHAPFLAVLLAAPILLRRAAAPLRRDVAAVAAIGVAIPLLGSIVFPAVSMRYEVDYALLLVVPALVVWMQVEAHAAGVRRLVTRALAVLAMGWSVAAMTALSLTGAYHTPAQAGTSPADALFRHLSGMDAWLARAFRLDDQARVRFRAAFPERPAAEEEPLLSSGSPSRSDLLSVRASGAGRWTFVWQPAAGPEQISPVVSLEPGVFHDFAVSLDRGRQDVRVSLDGAEVARFESALEPVRTGTLWLGRGVRGTGAVDLGQFSGVILSEGLLNAAPRGLEALPPLAPLPAVVTDTLQTPPEEPVPGTLWVAASRPGARLYDGRTWRWVPRHFLDRVRIDRQISFERAAAGTVEPILVSEERGGQADGIFVRHHVGGRIAWMLGRWQGSWVFGPESPELAIVDRLLPLAITLDRSQRSVEVRLDGQTILRAAQDLVPITRSGLRIGAIPERLGTGVDRFRGRIVQRSAKRTSSS